MDYEDFMMPKFSPHLSIGMTAPDFVASTTQGEIRLSDFAGKWVILFSHPSDFTPVCTTEFIAFAEAEPQFSELNTQLLGLSVDSLASHLAWIDAIYDKTGIEIPFPLIADGMGEIARLYGMLAPKTSTTETVRTVFFIDPNQKIRAILAYPMTNGRSIFEILRLLQALQKTDAEKVATPANWLPGMSAVIPAPKTYKELQERKYEAQNSGLNCTDWYLCYQNPAQKRLD